MSPIIQHANAKLQNPEPRTVSLTIEINLFAKNNHTFQSYSNQTKRIKSCTDTSNRKSKCREKQSMGIYIKSQKTQISMKLF